MKQMATVLRADNDEALVRVQRSEACGSCHACSLWSDKSEYIDLTVKNTYEAQEGDLVELDLDAPDVLRASFVMYIIPLIAMMGGVLLGYYVFAPSNEMIAALLGMIFLAISYITIKLSEKRIKNSGKYDIAMTGKIKPLIQ